MAIAPTNCLYSYGERKLRLTTQRSVNFPTNINTNYIHTNYIDTNQKRFLPFANFTVAAPQTYPDPSKPPSIESVYPLS